MTPTGQSDCPMIPPKIDGRVRAMSTWMKPGNPAYRPLIGGMWTVTILRGVGVVEAVDERDSHAA